MKQNNGVRLKDIAKEAGISVAAVSKVLNNKGGISKKTEERVRDIAGRLNYQPNRIARSLRTNKTNTIGIICADSSETFLAKVIKGIEDTAASLGYNVILCNTDDNYEKEKKVIEMLVSKRVDGLALLSTMLNGLEDYGYLKTLNIPFVFFLRRSFSKNADFAGNDNINGAYQMVSYMQKVCAEPVFFFNIASRNNVSNATERLEGYKKALAEVGRPFDEKLVYYMRPTVGEGYTFTKHFLRENKSVHSIFCVADVLAIGVMEAVLESGLKIPQDVKIGAYDDIDFAAYTKVPLTTIRQPRYDIGKLGTELLIKRINGATGGAEQIILKPELIVRQST